MLIVVVGCSWFMPRGTCAVLAALDPRGDKRRLRLGRNRDLAERDINLWFCCWWVLLFVCWLLLFVVVSCCLLLVVVCC